MVNLFENAKRPLALTLIASLVVANAGCFEKKTPFTKEPTQAQIQTIEDKMKGRQEQRAQDEEKERSEQEKKAKYESDFAVNQESAGFFTKDWYWELFKQETGISLTKKQRDAFAGVSTNLGAPLPAIKLPVEYHCGNGKITPEIIDELAERENLPAALVLATLLRQAHNSDVMDDAVDRLKSDPGYEPIKHFWDNFIGGEYDGKTIEVMEEGKKRKIRIPENASEMLTKTHRKWGEVGNGRVEYNEAGKPYKCGDHEYVFVKKKDESGNEHWHFEKKEEAEEHSMFQELEQRFNEHVANIVMKRRLAAFKPVAPEPDGRIVAMGLTPDQIKKAFVKQLGGSPHVTEVVSPHSKWPEGFRSKVKGPQLLEQTKEKQWLGGKRMRRA